ncbi:MAG: hypothetical protein JWM28_2053 [Chitinophagaceae bacterium]|nr:hypothetical protein [Chitinophagaceae bacterium]
MIPNDVFFTWFPGKRSTNIPDIDLLIATKLEFQFEEVDDKVIVKRKGVIVADKKTLTPLPPAQVIKNFFIERKWTPGPDQLAAGTNTLSKFTEKWKETNPGKNDISPEFDTALQAHVADVPGFDFYN